MKIFRFPKFQFRHLKNKILLLNAMGIILIVGLITIVTYVIAIQTQIKDAVRYDTIMVRQISKSIDNMVDSFNYIMDGVSFSNNVQSLLNTSYGSDKEMYQLNRELSSHVVDETMMFNEVDLIYLYDRENLRVSLRRSVDNKSYQYFDELHPEIYDLSGRVTWDANESVITANRVIYDVSSHKMDIIGYLTMSMKRSYLYDRIQSLKSTEERHLVILDQKNNMVLSNIDEEESSVYSMLQNYQYNPEESDFIIDVPDYGRMIVSNYQSDLTGWRIISLVSLNEIAKGPELISRSIIYIGILAIIFGIIVVVISTKSIVEPINKLSLVMDEVEQDNFRVQVHIDRADELGRVGESFNRLMNKINTLISDIYEKELNEKDAQLKALRAQINPHFLYNTLDAINWMAQFGEIEDVSKMTLSLSRLLKASINDNQDFIKIEDELRYIDDYMVIQKSRFKDKLEYSIQIRPEVRGCLVPKLILQPIVENAMIHGLEKKIGKGYLSINLFIKSDDLYIQILDDGIGMDENKVQSLIEGTHTSLDGQSSGTGNGVFNVQNRIRLIYGADYGVRIESTLNVGTLFELILPTHREGYKNDKSANY